LFFNEKKFTNMMAPLQLKRKRLVNVLIIILLCYLVSLLNHHFRTEIDNSITDDIKPQVRTIKVNIMKNIKTISSLRKIMNYQH
jgi:hypothetical protein